MHASMRVYSPVSRLRARWPLGTRSRMPPRPAPALIACLLGSTLAAQAALFSASATIEEGDTTYDGQDIIVSKGATEGWVRARLPIRPTGTSVIQWSRVPAAATCRVEG